MPRVSGVAIVGGGNSAGQAVVRFSRYASRVTLLVRGSTLGASMSQYLVSKVSELDNVDVRTHTEVVGLEADTRLRVAVLSSRDEAGVTRLPLESLFVCIGGVPRTRGLATAGLATDDAGFILTGAEVTASPGALDNWPLSRVHRCRSRRTGRDSSRPATCAADRSSGVLPRSARDQWQLRWYTAAWRSWVPSDDRSWEQPARPKTLLPSSGDWHPTSRSTRAASRVGTQRDHRASSSTPANKPGTPCVRSFRSERRCSTTPRAPSKRSASPKTSNDRAVPVSAPAPLSDGPRDARARDAPTRRRAGFRGRKRSRGHRGRVRLDRVGQREPAWSARLGCRPRDSRHRRAEDRRGCRHRAATHLTSTAFRSRTAADARPTACRAA